jgi:hypothetical protein
MCCGLPWVGIKCSAAASSMASDICTVTVAAYHFLVNAKKIYTDDKQLP